MALSAKNALRSRATACPHAFSTSQRRSVAPAAPVVRSFGGLSRAELGLPTLIRRQLPPRVQAGATVARQQSSLRCKVCSRLFFKRFEARTSHKAAGTPAALRSTLHAMQARACLASSAHCNRMRTCAPGGVLWQLTSRRATVAAPVCKRAATNPALCAGSSSRARGPTELQHVHG